MDKIIKCETCSTMIIADLGMGSYMGSTIRCAYCSSILIMSSIVLTPHIVPTRPMPTLYWSGSITSYPPLTIEPLIIESSVNWTFPPLPSAGAK